MNSPLSDPNNIEENNNEFSFNSNIDFFQIGFDDLMVASKFTTYLFDLSPESAVQKIIFPQNTSIIDFLSDPVAFTAVSTPEVVWSSIISPILSGKPETKPYLHQLLALLFKYFKDHPISFIESEINRRIELNKTANRERNKVVTSHYSSISQLFPNSDEFLLKILEDDNSFPAQQKKRVNPALFELTQKLYSDAKQKLTERHAFAFFKWGLHSNDISSVVYSLLFFGKLLIQQKKFQKYSFDFTVYKDAFYSFSLNNAVFTQTLQSQSSSIELLGYQPLSGSSSMIGCDESNIYLFGLNGSITRINLSTENLNIIDRFTIIPLFSIDMNNINNNNSRIGLATSNGYAIILGLKNKPFLYKLPDFQFISEISYNQNPKICLPLTSDGYYIYSLQTMKKKLNIFILTQNGYSFIKSVTLQVRDKKSLLVFNKIIPSDINFSTFCNGTVFTIVLFCEKKDDSYKYVFRHFSAIDGFHIIDHYAETKNGLLSICCYPWDRQIFEISASDNKKFCLERLSNYSAQPLWLSKSGLFESITFSHEISTARRLKDAFQYVLNFLSYYSIHFHGYSFRSFINNPVYFVPSSQFFAPCSLNAINAIIETIRFFITIYLPDSNNGLNSPSHGENSFPKELMKTSLFVLFIFLEMNLSNFADRKVEGKVTSIEGREGPIVDCFIEVIKHEELQFLVPMIGFIVSNSFQVLFQNPNEKQHDLFYYLYQNLPSNHFFYLIKQISNYPEFAYAFNNKKIRFVFSPILQKLKNATIDQFEKELLNSYMRSIMLEMRQVYTSFQDSFSPKEDNLLKSFHNFSTVVVEQATNFFLTIEIEKKKFDKIPFVIFFQKWLALLEPFPQFNRASLLITSIIQPINTTITQMIKKNNISCEPITGKKKFHKLSMIFYEIFSLYVNSISALLDGGAEIRDVCQYEWFVQSTNNEKVTSKKINEWVQKLNLNVGVITKGVSFIYSTRPNFNEQNINLSDLAIFINDLSSTNPAQSTELLMNYLHEKVKNPINKKLTEDDKKIERIILAALVKQLGLTNELFIVRSELEKKANPVISHLVKQTMTSLYRIRNQIRLSKQMTAQFQTKNTENMSLQKPAKYEDYDKFITEIMKKTAFLLNIEPWLSNNQENNLQTKQKEKDFSDMLKQLQSFITSKITIDQYLQMIESAVKSSQNISTGVAFILYKLREDIKSNTKADKVCSSYMIEQLSSNDSIQFYLSTLGKGVLQKDVANMVSLFPLLIDMIKNKSIEIPLYPLIVFFMNTSIIHFSEDKILNDIDKLIDILLMDPNTSAVPKEEINLVLLFIASALLNLIEIDSSFKDKEIVIQIFQKLIKSNHCNLQIEKICFKAGMEVPDKFNDLFSLISDGSPTDYHIISLFIFDMISKTKSKNEKIENIFKLIENISLTTSGCDSIIMSDFLYINQVHRHYKNRLFKSAPLIIGGCSELIQICRRLLNQEDEEMKFVIISILKYYKNSLNEDLIDSKLIQKMNEINLLFGVFSILSNLIEVIHSNSFIKNIKTNQIFYIESTNENNSIYDAWQLPINQDSIKIKIVLNSDFVPVPLMPFQSNLFNDFSLLIPYFNDALNFKLNKGLSILVFASLREYSTNVSFLSEFIQKLDPISLKNINYTNSLPFYLNLLHSHLMQKSDGFFENISNNFNTNFKLFDIMNYDFSNFYMSPFSINDIDILNKLFLISPIFPLDDDFQIIVNISCTNYDIGVFCPTLTTNIDHLYYSKREDNKPSSEDVKITYDKMMGVSIFVKGNSKSRTFSKKFENPFCLALNIMSPANVKYSFTKKNKTSLVTEKINKMNLETINHNEISLILDEDNEFVDNTFMSIPYNVLASLPHSFSIDPEIPDNQKLFPFLYDLQKEIDYWQTSENTLKIPIKVDLFKYLSNENNSYIFSTTNDINSTNNFTGKSFKIDVKDIEKVMNLPFVSLHNFPILPSAITNYYTNGIVSECRNEIFNWIFLNLALNSNSIPFEKTIQMFNITNQSLIKHVLNILLLLEPIFMNIEKNDAENTKNDSIEKVQMIDFDFNCLNPSSELKLTSLQNFSASMQKIIEFVEKSDKNNEFADAWLDLLQKQFNNGFSHSCTPSSPSGRASLFLNMKRETSPIQINRPDVIGWIISIVGFSTHYEMNEKKKKDQEKQLSKKILVNVKKHSFCKINGVRMTDPLTVVLNPSISIEFEKKKKTVVLIPISSNSNDSLIGSFFDLALSFKYFVHYVTMKKDSLKKLQKYKVKVYSLFFKGIISKSPFFYTYMADIFRFLQKNQRLSSLDFEDEFILSLNVLSFYCIKIPECENFLRELKELWSERVSISMMPFFPDFMTDQMKEEMKDKEISDDDFRITPSCFPDRVSSNSTELYSIISTTKRTLKKFDTIKGYPYHILLHDWAKYTMLYPPYESKNFSQKVVQITFLYFTPEKAVINVKNEQKSDMLFQVSDNFDMKNAISVEADMIYEVTSPVIFIECKTVDITTINFIITSPLSKHIGDDENQLKKLNFTYAEQFIFRYRQHFTTDMRTFATSMTSLDDQQILNSLSDKIYYKKKTLTFECLEENPTVFTSCIKSLHYNLNLISLRAKLLIALNWLISIRPSLLETDEDMRELKPSISISFKLSLFNEEISKMSSTDSSIKLTINRKEAQLIRLGNSNDLTKTIIYQMSLFYTDPSFFRCKSDKPWQVRFINEEGIDAGGLARELVNECATDLMCPQCGLVVPVPNSVNEVNDNSDFFIPIPSPKYSQISIEKLYSFCGALIAICIRTGLVQQFLFPPLVWEYILNGTIQIERIFEIDKNYEMLITSLSEAMKSDMTNDEFINRFNLKFVVTNSVGSEVPLTQRGKGQIVDKLNCSEFIAYANKFRLNELEQYLRSIRDGFWSNLGIKPLSILDWPTLEFAACGQSEIEVDSLINVTEFIGIDDELQKLFWKVIENFNSKERSELLKFATGRFRLPPKHSQNKVFLIIDAMSGTDILPTASTCFHKLHLPKYSSFQKAYKMIKIAIEYSGTFEKS